MTDQSFSGKVVIVTGSSSGIGAAAARAFSSLGACVTITSIDAENLDLVRQQCEKLSGEKNKILMVVGDITKDEVVEKILNKTVKTFGRLDVLINNAGAIRMGNPESTNMENFDFLVNLLVRAPFYLTKLAIPHLLESKGVIINTSSVAAERPSDDCVAYSLCKAAISNYTKSLALYLTPKGVRALAVCPGFIQTEIVKNSGLADQKIKAVTQRLTDCHLVNRPGKPVEIANLMVYLASDKAAFMTGSCVTIDGGYTAKQPRLQ